MESITAQIHLGIALTVDELRTIKEHAAAEDLCFNTAAVQFLKRGIRSFLAEKAKHQSEKEDAA